MQCIYILIILPIYIYSYELSICTIFQNEAKYLPEWIEFHEKNGVEHFYLYNNNSDDNFLERLTPYIDQRLITLVDWPYTYDTLPQWNKMQCSAYMHAVNSYGNLSTWMAFIDTDEFLFCPDGSKITHFLHDYVGCGAVSIPWVMYGTSNLNIPKGGRITDWLVMRMKNTCKTCKCIAQPKCISNIVNPHWVVLNHKMNVNENNEECTNGISDNPTIKKIRINHYWSRDLDFFYNIKLPRRKKWYGDTQEQIQIEKNFNEIYDPVLASPVS